MGFVYILSSWRTLATRHLYTPSLAFPTEGEFFLLRNFSKIFSKKFLLNNFHVMEWLGYGCPRNWRWSDLKPAWTTWSEGSTEWRLYDQVRQKVKQPIFTTNNRLQVPVFLQHKYSACHIICSQSMFDEGPFLPYPGFCYHCASLLKCLSTLLYFKSTLESCLPYVTFANHCSYYRTLKTFFSALTLRQLPNEFYYYLYVLHICINSQQLRLKVTER